MKKLLVFVLVLTLTFSITACKKEETNTGDTSVTAGTTPATVPEATPEAVPEETPEATPEPTPQPEEEPGVPGIVAGFMRDGAGGSMLNIILGTTSDTWPFADAEFDEDGNPMQRAFDPVPGRTYRIVFNVTSDDPFLGADGFRVRWFKTADYGDHTEADMEIVNDYPVAAADTAYVIPAVWNIDIEKGETYDLIVEVTLDGNEVYDGLIGNIGLRGLYGNNEWFCNHLSVELLEAGPESSVEELLVYWSRQ